jgi:anti-sigma B factor antagonist
MSLIIVERTIGDVSILDCQGRNTLGEGSSLLRDTIRNLVACGRKKIILNLAGVQYSDSAGQGELVSGFTTVTNQRGRLVLLQPTKRVKDLLQIQKLYTVFEVFDDEAQAIRYLEVSPLQYRCPVCGSTVLSTNLEAATSHMETCRDPKCGAQFKIGRSAERPGEDLIESVRIYPYPDEYLELIAGTPFRIAVVGRLNLFTSSSLEKLWAARPPRPVILDLRSCTEVTPQGRDVLLHLVAASRNDADAVVSLEGLPGECARVFTGAPRVYPDNAKALAALQGDAAKSPLWAARST